MGANRRGTAPTRGAFSATSFVRRFLLLGVLVLGGCGVDTDEASLSDAGRTVDANEPPVSEVDAQTSSPTAPSGAAGASEPATSDAATPSTTDLTSTSVAPGPTTATTDITKTSEPALADLLDPIDRGAAIPEDPARRPLPTGLQISSFDVSSYPIREIGLEDDGQLEIPDETEIGWYRYGATAGGEGATVLAAHVSWNGTTGPFFELDSLEPGAQVEVALDDGVVQRYEVTERTLYEKQNLPRERIWRNTGPEELVLITCGGDFNPDIRRYRHNVVVYAVPV